jgi:thymidylate synthase (FAD)
VTPIEFRSDFTTDIVQLMGDDDMVLRAMLISTLTDDKVENMTAEGKAGRIRFLMHGRHGTPFEQNLMTFRSEAPIFVYREWHRHRIGVSINEQSGRYVELPPMFYIPPPERPLLQVGKPGAYEYIAGDEQTYRTMVGFIKDNSIDSYHRYESLLQGVGVAKEVARMVLPVNIYSSMYWTCNARSLMAFLSLRVRCPSKQEFVDVSDYKDEFGFSIFPSKPMWEIDACARAIEQVFAQAFPLTHAAFVDFGRVCP